MNINEFKMRVENILLKEFTLKEKEKDRYILIENTDKKDPIEINIFKLFGELAVKTNDNAYTIYKFLNEISKLNNENVSHSEKFDIYVKYLNRKF